MPCLNENRLGRRNVCKVCLTFSETNKLVYTATLKLIEHSRSLKNAQLDTKLKIHLEAITKILKETLKDQKDCPDLSLLKLPESSE